MTRARWLTLLKAAAFALVLGLAARAIWQSGRQVDLPLLRPAPLPLGGAVACFVLVYLMQMVSYRTLLSAYVTPPRWRAMAAVAWVPPLGKYVPGKVASLLGAVWLLRRLGVASWAAVSAVLVMDGLAVLSGLISGAPLLWWGPLREAWPWGRAVAGGVVALGALLLHPRVYGRLVNVALRLLKRPALPRPPDGRRYAAVAALMFGQWALAGLALWLTCAAVAPLPAAALPWCVAVAALAYTVGYLALFAPGGLGPRELVFQYTLVLMIGGSAAVVVVLMRLLQTGVELAMAAAGMALLPRGGAADGAVGSR